ncbi:MAG: hypothetical protein OEW06_02710 [Gemmatimonadota bacterium]|nr:hypothetical protein [Gemmatimonadota bacterium]
MRPSILATSALLLVVAACSRPVPFTTDIRQEMGASASEVAALDLSVLETFELRTAGRTTIVVKNWTKAIGATAPSDTTLVLDVLGAQVAGQHDTLKLTFARGRAGAYTLRQVNGAWIGESIPVAGISYQYHPCYQNVGSKCDQPVPSGTREDQQVRVGIKR